MLWPVVLYVPSQTPYLMASAGNTMLFYSLPIGCECSPKVDLSSLLRVFYAP